MGIALLDLPWSVTGVMLADGQEYHTRQQHNLAQVFSADLLQGKRSSQCNISSRAV